MQAEQTRTVAVTRTCGHTGGLAWLSVGESGAIARDPFRAIQEAPLAATCEHPAK
jgi:hypothetical protein